MTAKVSADLTSELETRARDALRRVQKRGLSIATAESCTGGMLSSLLTDIEGLSGSFERGFAVYSKDAKAELLGIDRMLIERHGVVSREVAVAMAKGALANSHADLAVSITGFAGPADVGDEEGLVHVAVASASGLVTHRECHFGNAGRTRTRELAVMAALEMLECRLSEIPLKG